MIVLDTADDHGVRRRLSQAVVHGRGWASAHSAQSYCRVGDRAARASLTLGRVCVAGCAADSHHVRQMAAHALLAIRVMGRQRQR
jgi:hypothetical protein